MENKFRAWDKARNEMYEPHTLHVNPKTREFMSIRFNGDYGEDSILMLITPFVDAKGQRIYESDIIEFTLEDGTKERGTVRFAAGGYWTTQPEGHSEELLSEELEEESFEATIVGHIYQPQDGK